MLRSLLGIDWRKSSAHLLLLSKFLHPRSQDDYAESDSWKAVLGEAPAAAVHRFIDERVLTQASLAAKLDYRFKVTQLTDMLRQRRLPIAGCKDALIRRLVQADPVGMEAAVAGLSAFVCSETGQEFAENYLSAEKLKRAQVEQEAMQYLQQRQFREASLTVAAYEATQVFPRGLGIDWKNYDPTRDITILNLIFTSKPRILSKLDDDHLRALRLAAAMISLLGTNRATAHLPPNFDTGLAIGNDAAARMFLFYASHHAELSNYRKSGVVRQVEVLAAQDSCQACKKLSGRTFRLHEVPELPNEHCTHEMGCRCALLPIVD